MLKIRSGGIFLDIAPKQDISITIDNPLFENDKIPIAVSTTIEFVNSIQNQRAFQLFPVMMVLTKPRKIPAELIANGITLFSGQIILDEFTDNVIHGTFVGAKFEDIVFGNIADIPLPIYKNKPFLNFVKEVRKGSDANFGLPMLIRKGNLAKLEYVTSTNAENPECAPNSKYANWLYSETSYIIPAIKVDLILAQIIPKLVVNSRKIIVLLEYLAILGLYKNEQQNNRYGVEYTENAAGEPESLTLNLADSLPNMPAADFVINFLKMTCSSLFWVGEKFILYANQEIITSSEFVDWSDKIADTYSYTPIFGQNYSLSFKNKNTNNVQPSTDGLNQSANYTIIGENMMDVISKIKISDQYINVKNIRTGDIFCGKKINALLYYYAFGAPVGSQKWDSLITPVPTLDIVYQARFESVATTINLNKESYDCTVDFVVPKCIPAEVYTTKPIEGYVGNPAIGLRAIAPIVEFPTVGGDRPTDVYIGLLTHNNFVDKGVCFTEPTPDVDGGTEFDCGVSLATKGEKGIYQTMHTAFAEWLSKDKDLLKINLNLTHFDIANLQIWRKIMLCNRLFFIKTLTIMLNTSKDEITTEADIVSA